MWIDGEIGNYMKKKEKNKYFFGTNKTQMNIEEYVCILQSPADSDAFQSGRCAKHNGRPETMYF